MLAQVVGALADFALAGQKHQHVAGQRAAAPELIHRIGNRLVQAVVAAFLEGAVALLHRKTAALHIQHRRRPLGRLEVARKALGVDGRRGDDHLQVRPPGQDLAQVAEQKIDVQAALVRLVDDQRVVGLQQRVGLGFGQQNAVGHELDRGMGAEPVLEAHLVAHHLAQRRAKLLRNAAGYRTGCDAARLGVADQAAALARSGVQAAAPQAQRDLGQLGGFAGTGLAAHHDHLVRAQGGFDRLALGAHRQGFGKLDNQGAGGSQGK